MRDVDGDGRNDLLLRSVVPDPRSPTGTEYRTWVLSGRDLSPLYSLDAPRAESELLVYVGSESGSLFSSGAQALLAVRIRDSRTYGDMWSGARKFALDAHGVTPLDPEEEATHIAEDETSTTADGDWTFAALIDPGIPGWVAGSTGDGEVLPEPLNALRSAGARMAEEYPALRGHQVCGDLNGDGVLDWLGLASDPCLVFLMSGRDMRILRTIPLSAHRMATAATGGFELGDVDGDGVSDWCVGAQVSQSDERLTPRTCHVGVLSIVSGADLHVIATIEREAFLAGAGASCPVVRLPE
jgi:hypothetical protein